MTDLAGPDELRRRVAAHSPRAQVAIVLSAVVVGYYGTWLAGDYGGRPVDFVVFTLVTGYVLVQQPTGRAVVARGLYLLAGLVLVTPVFLNLPLLTGPHPGITSAAGLVFHPGVYAFSLVFVGVAAGLAAVGYLVGDRRG